MPSECRQGSHGVGHMELEGGGVVGSFLKAKNKITPLPSPLLHVVHYSRRGRDSPKNREESQEFPRDINLDLSSLLGEF